ncbi:hypothetical protein BDV25DRAFT_134093 [Aspergillus avenaceus]|uniref:3'(2'),5'-bisphosphate nucleotidase n=1 Tax=Aspergillus avenaceus TaxID=36643 RepID=A0A5N6TFH0_ASPAV|nr:hypothetical protein BDV25DRAFT_134093 [Aspergillus avenaceus]
MEEVSYEKEHHVASLAVYCASIFTKTAQKEADIYTIVKPDASPVTDADYASQAILISAIRHHFPQDGFIAEESAIALRRDPGRARRVWELVSTANLERHENTSVALPESLEDMLAIIDIGGSGNGAKGKRTWIIDPIDGTASFVQGQQFAIAVALIEAGEQRVGVVGYPNLIFDDPDISEEVVDEKGFGMMLSAVKGKGAYKRQMTKSSLLSPQKNALQPWRRMAQENIVFTESSESHVIDQDKHKTIRDILLANPPLDIYSMQVKYAVLSIGTCNAMIRLPKDKTHRFPAWDHAGGTLIFEESGGRVTDLYGHPFIYASGQTLAQNEGLVAAKAGLHTDLVRYARHIYEKDSED